MFQKDIINEEDFGREGDEFNNYEKRKYNHEIGYNKFSDAWKSSNSVHSNSLYKIKKNSNNPAVMKELLLESQFLSFKDYINAFEDKIQKEDNIHP